MRYVFTGLLVGIIFGSGPVTAKEPPDAKCLALAKEFSQDPESLSIQELERLRFCLHQTMEYRERNLKGEVLKGTIIDPVFPSGKGSVTHPSTGTKNRKTNP